MSKRIKIKTVIKRNGSDENFSIQKLQKSITLAGKDTKAYSAKTAKEILSRVKKELAKLQEGNISYQEIRDIVEPIIAEAGFFKAAKHYIVFKEKEKREEGIKVVEPDIAEVSLEIAKKRYLRTDMKGKVTETPGEMFLRVAKHFAKAQINWGDDVDVKDATELFYERMVNWKFVCSGKAMFEAGNPGGTGQLSACFVLPIEDSISKIFKTLGYAAVVHKNNGGTGFNFSKIRPHGDKVRNVPNAASGPVDFLKAYSATLAQILQGAKRQGANIAVLNVDHPDIVDFIHLKDQDGTIKNFNISVGVTNEFMEAVERDDAWELTNPRNKEVVRKVKARELFNLIAEHAWISGDPGLAFLDRMEADNPTPSLGTIDATNPCGEIPLLPYESCNLTSICLQNHLKIKDKRKKDSEYEIDWDDLEKTVRAGVNFLDNMIEVNAYPIKEIEDMVKYGNRRIGLGVMGFAHLLYKLGVPYNSKEAVRIAGRLAKFIHKTAESASIELAKERGVFPNFDISIYAGTAERYRNCALTMVAPTGTISLLANTSSGIEPVFSLVTLRRAFNEDDKENRPTREFMMVDPVFEEELAKIKVKNIKCTSCKKKLKSQDEVLACTAKHGLSEIKGLPKKFYKVFTTTHEIAPEWHVRIQAAWQRWFDNSISKTINFGHSASVEDIKKAYRLAWKLGCKGITIYRDGSKDDQVLNLAKTNEKSRKTNGEPAKNGKTKNKKNGDARVPLTLLTGVEQQAKDVVVSRKMAMKMQEINTSKDKCPECSNSLVLESGCATCKNCGWSKCVI